MKTQRLQEIIYQTRTVVKQMIEKHPNNTNQMEGIDTHFSVIIQIIMVSIHKNKQS